MAVLKCKMCGGDLVFETGATICECEYCGSKQTIPNADNEKKITLFARANRLLRSCEFDKAEGIFGSIAAEFPEEAEAYWGLVLCKYGIEYVDDPVDGKKVPTCHRSSFDSVMDDADFDQVMENADTVARAVYREQAKQIEEIRKGIIEVSGKEAPYDIFICYKETAEDGQRTIDSVLAQDVYDVLTARGYRVFFSRISLEDKLGTEYEPYIFAALNSAKVMLAFGTTYDYYNAVWVKNEWSRFLKLMAVDKGKYLIPCYKDIDAYDIPKEFAKLQAQDLGKIGATQDLLRGIDKLIGPGRFAKENNGSISAETNKQLQAMLDNNTGGPNPTALLKRGMDALEDKEFQRAKDYFDQTLNMDAENGEAFFGLYLAEHSYSNQAAFSKAYEKDSINQADKNLCRAMKYASGELKVLFDRLKREKEIRDDSRQEKLRAKITEQKYHNRDIIPELLKTDEQVRQLSLMIDKLMSVKGGNLSDSGFRLTEMETVEKEKLAEKAAALAREVADAEQEYINLPEQAEKKQIQREITEIKDILPTLGFFQGKKKKELEAKLPELERNLQRTNDVLADYKKTIVEKRKRSKECDSQLKAFDEYKLSQRIVQLNEEKKRIQNEVLRRFEENPYIGFGTYPYERNGEKAPIEWIIIDISQGVCSMISRYCLDVKPYHEGKGQVQWDESTIRKWLNQDFFNDAFSVEEQEFIIPAENPYSSAHATDKVYLLSKEQGESVLTNKQQRKTYLTSYASRNGERYRNGDQAESSISTWWLGDTYREGKDIIGYYMGYNTSPTKYLDKPKGVRPVITVDLRRLEELSR